MAEKKTAKKPRSAARSKKSDAPVKDSPKVVQTVTGRKPTLSERLFSLPGLRRLRIPIQVKLSITITFLIWITILVLSFVILNRQRDQLYQQTFRTGKVTLTLFEQNAAVPLLNEDLPQLNTLIKEVTSIDGLLYAFITDHRDIIRAHVVTNRIGTKFVPDPGTRERFLEDGTITRIFTGKRGTKVLDLARPIRLLDKKIGTVHVGVSLDFINTHIRNESISIIIMSLFIVMLGISIAIMTGIGFSRPINELVEATEQIGQGNFDYRLPSIRNDEFGDLATSFNYMAEELNKKLLIQKSFGQYVSPEILDMILANPEGQWLKGTRSKASVLFTDIRGFTAFSENNKPEKVVEYLNESYSIITDAIQDCGGYVDKFIGDAVLGVFGVPASMPNHAERAVQAAFAIQERLAEAATKSDNPLLPLVGISISTGVLVAGNLGSQSKVNYTVIGDTVNVASRLNGKADAGGIVFSVETYQAAKRIVEVEEMEPQMFKGKSEPIQVYRAIALKGKRS